MPLTKEAPKPKWGCDFILLGFVGLVALLTWLVIP